MNLLLLNSLNFLSDDEARVTGRQLEHVHKTLASKTGDTLQVGKTNGAMGTGEILRINEEELILKVSLTEPPPPPLPCKLILALPRPKMLKRTLQTAVAMGVKEIYLINSWKVEKSYWQSPWLSPDNLQQQMVLGLEQAKDTILPRIHTRKLFKPFVEDELPTIITGTEALVAHPRNESTNKITASSARSIAIGPEGGFTEYEVGKLEEAGFRRLDLGKRILRVENAVPVCLSKAFPCHF